MLFTISTYFAFICVYWLFFFSLLSSQFTDCVLYDIHHDIYGLNKSVAAVKRIRWENKIPEKRKEECIRAYVTSVQSYRFQTATTDYGTDLLTFTYLR